ncbi:MAG: ABC transporter permease [Gammaproteobacteria bacterium]|nr:ABC transporter permease [Gammaproteobacteria bacterium]MDH3448760.1 ABC transporter permease [Gammaproteobacteria bacterium]
MNRGFVWILKALLSHYWRHPWQTLFMAIGLIAGVGLWSAVQIINQHAEASYRQAQSLLGAQASYWIQSRRDEGIEQSLYIDLRRAGFRQVFPLIELEVGTVEGISVSIIATDLLALPGDAFGAEGDTGDFAETWLKFVQPPYRAWVPEALARELRLEAGAQLRLRGGRSLPPALIQAREQQGRRVLLDIGAAMSLSGSDRFSYLAVGPVTQREHARLAALLPEYLELTENQQHIDLRELTESLHSHLTAMSLLSFAVGLFIVFNAVRFSLWYRRATILDLRLMGCATQQLFTAILLETLLWSLIGTALGFGLGILLAHALLPGLGASLQSLYAATVDSDLGLSPLTLLQAWSITLLGLVWALSWPLYRQLQQSSLEAGRSAGLLRDEAVARRRLALAALALALIAGLGYGRIETVTQGFVVLGLMLFAAAWLLPILLAAGLLLAGWLVPRSRLLPRWMVSDGWSQMPALRSAMMALLLALTANLGVGTLVDSFRNAFVGWLEVRQSADIYLRGPRVDYGRLRASPSTRSWLAASHYRIGVNTRWRDRPTLVRGIDPRAPDSLELPLSLWQGESAAAARRVWREQPGKVLINEQLHFLAGVELGETIELNTDGGARKFEVVGVFYDYGNPYFQFYLPYEVVARNWSHHYSRGIALWLKHDNNEAMQQAEASLTALGARPGDWISQAQVRRLSVGIFDRTFAITAAMNGLTMIVAAIALLASLLAILQERLPQFAQWRALGLRQGEQLLLVATPLLIFCVIAWLMSIPLGALLSWILIHKLNIISFGWSMPLVWEFEPALRLALLVLLICAATLLLVSYQWRRKMPQALAQLGETI